MPEKNGGTAQGVEDMLNDYVPPKAEEKKDDTLEEETTKEKDDTQKKKDDDLEVEEEKDDKSKDDIIPSKEKDDDKVTDDEVEEDDKVKEEEAKKDGEKSKEDSALSQIIASIRAGKKEEEEIEEKEPEKKGDDKPVVAPVKKGESYTLITQEVLDQNDGVLNAEILNAFGTTIINAAIQGALKSTPIIVGKQLKRRKMFDNLITAFYDDNTDLLKHKPYVSFTAQQLAGKHPDWDETKIFEALAVESRKGLGIKEQARKVEDNRSKKKPALPDKTRTKRRKRGSDDEILTPIQKEIEELI